MKILMICDFYHEDLQYQENFLTRYYLKYNHEVTIIASTFTSIFDYYSNNYNSSIKGEEYSTYGYKIARKPYRFNFLNKIRRLEGVKKILFSVRPDMIYVHGPILNLWDAISYKKANPFCRMVFDFHGDFSNSANNWVSKNILHKLIFRYTIQYCRKWIDNIYYVTPESGLFLNLLYKIPHKKMELLPLGADLDKIKMVLNQDHRKIIRDNLKINQDDYVLFTGGKITPQKRTHLVIEAFQSINNEHLHLIIAGDTKDESYKIKLLDLIRNNPRIHYMGWVESNDMYHYMSACDIAVFPSSQSILWQQAIGIGLPLIVGQIENQDASYLNQNNNMIILDSESITQKNIAVHIKNLILNPVLLKKMKGDAIKTAEDFLSFEKIALKTLNEKM